MAEQFGEGEVVGRWELGRGQPLGRSSTIHPARFIGGDDVDQRLVEIHRLGGGFDPSDVVARLRQASRVTDPGLVTIVDVGSAELDGASIVFVATTRWDEALGRGPRTDGDLRAMARSLAGGLATLIGPTSSTERSTAAGCVRADDRGSSARRGWHH